MKQIHKLCEWLSSSRVCLLFACWSASLSVFCSARAPMRKDVKPLASGEDMLIATDDTGAWLVIYLPAGTATMGVPA